MALFVRKSGLMISGIIVKETDKTITFKPYDAANNLMASKQNTTKVKVFPNGATMKQVYDWLNEKGD